MKKKGMIILVLLLFTTSISWAQIDYIETSLVIGVDSELWFNDVPSDGFSVYTITAPQGETVYGGYGTRRTPVHFGRDYVTNILYNNQSYYMYSNNLRPASGVYLPDDWITTVNTSKKWVRSYYLDALRSQNRNTFLQYEKTWIDFHTEAVKQNEGTEGWYNFFGSNAFESLIFNGAGIIMGGFATNTFFIMNIVPFNNGYKITMTGDKWFYELPHNNELNSLPFPLYSERQSFDMIFLPDGDYMDVYLDSLDNKFATFAKVDAWVLDELEKLVETNTCDISQIKWPRRASKQLNVGEEGLVLENLRLRTSPDTAGSAITTMREGTRVTILEVGHDATIDGVTAPWVKVRTSDGETGWCFGFYLSETTFDSALEELTGVAGINVAANNNGDDTALSAGKKLGFLVVFMAGLIIAAVGIVIFILKRKKAQ